MRGRGFSAGEGRDGNALPRAGGRGPGSRRVYQAGAGHDLGGRSAQPATGRGRADADPARRRGSAPASRTAGQRVLGDKLLMSGGNITTVVDNLERRGLVRRERRGDDRRHVTVHLTSEGRRLISRVFPGHVAAIVEAFSALTPAEQEQLGRLA